MEHLQWADVIIGQGQVVVRLDQEVIVETCTPAALARTAFSRTDAGKHPMNSHEQVALSFDMDMMSFQAVGGLQGKCAGRCRQLWEQPSDKKVHHLCQVAILLSFRQMQALQLDHGRRMQGVLCE